MKIRGYCLLIVGLFAACTSSDPVDYGLGEYYVEIATALNDHDFLLDNGKIVYESDKTSRRSFEAGNRVYLSFSYEDGISDHIRVHRAAKIFGGELKAVEEKEITAFPNSPVRLESAWIGSHYLNLQFYMDYKSETHKIALMTDKTEIGEQKVKLYFRHDKNNDAPGYPILVYVSFDLEKVLGEYRGDRDLLINFNTTNYGNKIDTFKY